MKLPSDGLIKFYADWCAPCHAIAPVLKKVCEELSISLLEIDIEQNPHLVDQFSVRSIPMVVAISNGEPIDASVGAYDEAHYRELAQKVLGD